MKSQKKFWAKKDELYTNEVFNEPAPADPFKANHVYVPKKEVIANKIVDN